MASNAKELNGNNGEENSFKVVFRWKHISSKFNQDVPIFFDSGYRLKSEWLFTRVWGIENEPKPYPLLMVYSTTNWSKPNSNPFVVSLGILMAKVVRDPRRLTSFCIQVLYPRLLKG